MSPFTTPSHLTALLIQQTENAYLDKANQQVDFFNGEIAKGENNGTKLNLWSSGMGWFKAHYVEGTSLLHAVTRNTDKVVADARDAANSNIALLEERVSQHLSDTDVITGNQLFIVGGRIEGYVYGTTRENEAFNIFVRMIWNYRYGENSANRVITQYAQFRSERQGARQEGKPVVTERQAAAEAAKSEREAAKEARRSAQLEKFKKAPTRLARASRKNITVWGESHPSSPMWDRIATYADAMPDSEVEELFAKGFRTSGDLESYLERQLKREAVA